MNKTSSWETFKQHYLELPELGFSLDTSLMNVPDVLPNSVEKLFQGAFQQMQDLEVGSIANPDENRMVGHYWLRNPELAPSTEIKNLVSSTVENIQQFAQEIHQKILRPPKADYFRNVLLLGIGGSALAPQFMQNALASESDCMQFYFLDNTDPDGIDQVMSELGDKLNSTLTLVISKSGGTKETRNAMLEVRHLYEKSALDFSRHAVAVTGEKSQLDQLAERENWLRRFPMWDWVGGRTSVFSAVGMLPAALQGLDIKKILHGAKVMDELTRCKDVAKNPAAVLAWMWHHAGAGRGEKAMVMLPYKDRLLLFSRYLQQLVMESLGKEKDLEGKTVHQGLSVYGNKGSTDQHAFVQQLREGPADFFVTFIEVLKDRKNVGIEVEPGITSGDYLQGFMLGTSSALFQNGRPSLNITLDEINPQSLGALIALFERAVGLYASLIGINAYHQPGVEAGKRAAGNVIELSLKIQFLLKSRPEQQFTAASLAEILEDTAKTVTVFKLLEHLAANGRVQKISSDSPFSAEFKANP
ncbi:MAG: glucose-6-phosphate isomerase [SAR324 cluster bacterium]|nr:glucose-6-phosphate isomerase [SAR324 cluster bacterium]